jgi:ADP-heptose:LPS heptosyltransferase
MKIKKAFKVTTIHLMKYLFGTVKNQLLEQNNIGSMAILAQERFGDLIALTPLLKHLRKAYPDAEIVIIGVTDIIEFLKHDENLDSVLNGKRIISRLSGKIFKKKFDLLFNTKDHPSFTFLYLSRRIKAYHRVGLDHPYHRGYFNQMIPTENAQSAFEKNCLLLDYLNIKVASPDIKPYLPSGPISMEIQDFVKSNFIKQDVIGINLSASRRFKEWQIENWLHLLSLIKQPVVVLAMPEHQGIKKIIEKSNAHVIKSPQTKTIFDAGHIIRNLKLLISPDTSLIHVASCFNIPVIAFYRLKEDLMRFSPLSDVKEVIIAPRHEINNISPEQVYHVFERIWTQLSQN